MRIVWLQRKTCVAAAIKTRLHLLFSLADSYTRSEGHRVAPGKRRNKRRSAVIRDNSREYEGGECVSRATENGQTGRGGSHIQEMP